jgi:hypothetical protein
MTAEAEVARFERNLREILGDLGLVVPEAWWHGTLAGYEDMRRMTALLHRPRPAENEPALVFLPTFEALPPGR